MSQDTDDHDGHSDNPYFPRKRKMPDPLHDLQLLRDVEIINAHVRAKRLNIDVWFADPHAPWQGGSNENTNGLLRQFMPKGADLSKASQEYLNNVADLMNARPRRTHGWKTPHQALEEEIAKFNSRVALAS